MTVIIDGTNGITGVNGSASAPSVTGTDTDTGISYGTNLLYLNTGGSTRVTVDASGNVGVGVTPASWESSTYNYKPIQLGYKGYITGWLADTRSYVEVGANAYYTTSAQPKYLQNGYATSCSQLDGAHAWYTAASGTAGNNITWSTRMTLDNSGNLGLGMTPSAAGYPTLEFTGGCVYGHAAADFRVLSNAYYAAGGSPKYTTTAAATMYRQEAGTHYWYTAASGTAGNTITWAEKMKLTANGYLQVSNTGTHYGADSYSEFYQSNNNEVLLLYAGHATYTASCLFIDAARNTTNSSFYAISYYNSGAAAYKFRVNDAGSCTNTSGSYTAFSDLKLKQDIVDAGSQWEDIKALRFRKFRLKSEPEGPLYLGLVAQEVEPVCPALIDEHRDTDREGNDLGTTTKAVKYSILHTKGMKALQEALLRIEQLESEVAALKGAK